MIADFERTPKMRASDADRDMAADRLRIAAGEGRLDPDELDERLTSVYRARWCSELVHLVSDVTPPAARVMRPVFVHRAPAKVNLMAVASLLSGLFWMGWVGSVAAVPLGLIALRQIRESEGAQLGRSLALIGVFLGLIGVLTLLAFSGLLWRGVGWD